MAKEVVYFVAIRTTDARQGAEVREALKRLNDEGVLPATTEQGEPSEAAHAVAWVKPYDEMTANDNGRLEELGLEDFDHRNQIATVAWETQEA